MCSQMTKFLGNSGRLHDDVKVGGNWSILQPATRVHTVVSLCRKGENSGRTVMNLSLTKSYSLRRKSSLSNASHGRKHHTRNQSKSFSGRRARGTKFGILPAPKKEMPLLIHLYSVVFALSNSILRPWSRRETSSTITGDCFRKYSISEGRISSNCYISEWEVLEVESLGKKPSRFGDCATFLIQLDFWTIGTNK